MLSSSYPGHTRCCIGQRKVTTAKSKYAIADFDRVKAEFLEDVVATVEMEEIPWS